MMRLIKIFILSLYLIHFAACSPAKGYLGPELQEDKLATVYYKNCGNNLILIRASAEGVEFTRSGIHLLPGKRAVDVTIEKPSAPYNCVPHTEFNEIGFQLCLERRQEAINNNEKYIPNCYNSDYTTSYDLCHQQFQQFICAVNVDLLANTKYEVCPYEDYTKIKLKLMDNNLALGLKDCEGLDSEVRNIRID